jgi:hypothetical protein
MRGDAGLEALWNVWQSENLPVAGAHVACFYADTYAISPEFWQKEPVSRKLIKRIDLE